MKLCLAERGTLCILGGWDLHFGGCDLHSWRVWFAFWGVHFAFLVYSAFLGGALHIFGGALYILGVYLAFCIYTLHSWRVHFHSWGCTLYFWGLLITLDSGYTLLSWDSTHNKQIHGWGFILWVHCIFGPQFCAWVHPHFYVHVPTLLYYKIRR